MLNQIMGVTVKWWNEAGYVMVGAQRRFVFLSNHVIWAGNIWEFATSAGMYQCMLDILT